MKIAILFLTLCFLNPVLAQTKGSIDSSVVYGDDNRKDLYELEDEQKLKLAQSTVALIRHRDMTAQEDNQFKLKLNGFGEKHNLCQDEAFYHQPTAPYCSGFLVAKNKVVTAGHCIRTQSNCNGISFVFGYNYDQAEKNLEYVSSSEVYNCKTLIHSEVNGRGHDFAVIELDREVENHEPLEFRTEGVIAEGQEIFVVGHPSGLPAKLASEAKVRTVKEEHFVTNLDTFGGNSGSAVFNAQTGLVEGILVRGEVDFVYKKDENGNRCKATHFCEADKCRGEDVTKITEALEYL